MSLQHLLDNKEKTDVDTQAFVKPGNMKDGRKYHDDPSSNYWLPADEEEVERLSLLDRTMKDLFGTGIYQPLKDVIGPKLEKGGKFLDLCCGTGLFVSGIAKEYPNSECVGIDLVDNFQRNHEIENVSFQSGNVLKGLPFEDNTFDAISLNFGILAFSRNDWEALTKEVYRVLKPGGYMLSKEPARILSDDDFATWVIDKFFGRVTRNGQVADIAQQLRFILMETGFDEIGVITKPMYLGRPGEVNARYHKNTVLVFKGMLPKLSSDLEINPDQYEEFMSKFSKHIDEPNAKHEYTFTYGRKPIYNE